MIAGLLSRLLPRASPRNVAVPPTGRTLSLDNPADWADLIENTESAAGITVTHSKALTLAPVWQSVSMISGDVASMTLNVFLRDDDDSRHIDKDHPAEPIVSQVANEDTPAYEFWRRTMAHALLWGNGYAWIERASPRRGAPTALYNLLPDRTTPRWDRATKQLYYITEVDGKLWPLFKEEVLHVKGLSVDVGVGADLVAAARDAFGLGLALQGFSSKFFAQGAQAAGVLEVPPHLSPEAVRRVAEGWQKQISGSDNWFKVAILREGVKFHATTISPENAQSHEMREDSRRDVASFFNLPPFKLGIADSVSYNSAEQAQLAYLTSTLNHWRMAISSECDLKLLDREDVLTGQRYFEHNVSNLIEIDIATLTDVLAKQLEVELISPNEGRRKLNLPPRTDPGGDEYANPNTKGRAAGHAPARAGTRGDGGSAADTGADAPPASDAEAAASGSVQATALNGAQITALLQIANQLALGELPPDGTHALIEASFPLMDRQLIDRIVNDLQAFEPPEPAPVPGQAPPVPSAESPAPEPAPSPPPPPADRLAPALRPLLAEATGRLARRIAHDLRTLAKKPARLLAWLDSGGHDHRGLVVEGLGGVGAAVAVARGLDDLATAGLQATLAAAFLDDLHGQLSPLVEPPHSSADLTTNVDKACGAWETGIAARLEQLAFGE